MSNYDDLQGHDPVAEEAVDTKADKADAKAEKAAGTPADKPATMDKA